jgi:hypothetical protein
MRACLFCKAPFQGHPNRRYCTPQCYHDAHRLRKRKPGGHPRSPHGTRRPENPFRKGRA